MVDDVYLKLHSLSKSLEGKGRIDEYDNPDAYGDILDAMKAVKELRTQLAEAQAKLQEAEKDWEKNYESAVKGRSDFRDLCRELRTQLAEAQAKLQETCLQVAGAVWVTAAPDKVVDIQTCVDIVKRIMQEQTK